MKTIDDLAAEYVQQHGRYSKEAPALKYHVRYPATASRAFFADCPSKLTPMVAAAMQLEAQEAQSRA